jgi:nucleotide-binding universal stress UspA family protein
VTAYGTVLVGTDGSESSFRAVDKAAALAADSHARLVIVCAYHPMPARDRQRAADVLGDLAYMVAGAHPAEDIVGDAAQRAGRHGAADVVTVAVEGEPVDVLLDQTVRHAADLLVTGNRGIGSLAGRLLGSVPQSVAQRSPVDVLVVHTTGR